MNNESDLENLKRQIRILQLFSAAEEVGMSPLRVNSFHMMAYFTDVLAPVWNLPLLDSVILKRLRRPFFPRLQSDLDSLVGHGLVQVSHFEYFLVDEKWNISAEYYIHWPLARPVMDAIRAQSTIAKSSQFVREVVFAMAAFGEEGIPELGHADAAYSNPLVDVGDVIDMSDGRTGTNPSAAMALRFRHILDEPAELTDPELVHLYVRHLYTKMQAA